MTENDGGMKQPDRSQGSDSARALLHARKLAKLTQAVGLVQSTLVKARKLRAIIVRVRLDPRDQRIEDVRASLSKLASILEDLHSVGFGSDLDWFAGRSRLMALRLRTINLAERDSAASELDGVDYELNRLEGTLRRKSTPPPDYRS